MVAHTASQRSSNHPYHVASESIFDANDASEAAVEHELSPCFDLLRTPLSSSSISHRKSERGFSDVVNW
jgi:hypothetical protein